MRSINLNFGWTIQKGEPSKIPMMPVQTQEISLPHDFMIAGDVAPDSKNGPNTGYYNGGTYTYAKTLDIPAQWEGRRVLVCFDGVFGQARVMLNGHIVGAHHYGYTPFAVELSEHLYYGRANQLAVVVSNENEPNSRWYPGGGIYRDVTLMTSPLVHIAVNGLCLRTDHIVGGDAFVTAMATVENHTARPFCGWVNFQVRDANAAGRIRVYVPRRDRRLPHPALRGKGKAMGCG